MASEGMQIVKLQDDFYRDSFVKLFAVIASILIAIILLISLSIYLYVSKQPPITFRVAEGWRVQSDVSVENAYLSTPDMLQWVNDAIQQSFVYDFYHYNDQLKTSTDYFTPGGWERFLNQLNIYANYTNVQTYKMFINAAPTGAPIILQQGLLSGRYAWWVQLPIDITYIGTDRTRNKSLTLQVLVVRVSTLNNLSGVSIDNVIVADGS
ncbi:MAG: hypothetical protein A3F14_06525 [Gammaproteobacteria bacterium RIFCSPHIGHO2_12_FULL_43_28]|nr:MAG: hypothetical protein A3F14_06525 [Gammaproteobacteria bacterium RIFCSPHIGHO2_12_FULL_43_28]